MELHDDTRFFSHLRYRARVRPGQTLVQTFDGITEHPFFGPTRTLIHRAIGNDSGLKVRMTVDLLKKHEPKVQLWPGDAIQYLDENGQVLDEVFGGVDERLEAYVNSFKEA